MILIYQRIQQKNQIIKTQLEIELGIDYANFLVGHSVLISEDFN